MTIQNRMTVECKPIPTNIKLSAPNVPELPFQVPKAGVIPTGWTAEIGNIRINDYRGRPAHEAGATISTQKTTIQLPKDGTPITLGKFTFRWSE